MYKVTDFLFFVRGRAAACRVSCVHVAVPQTSKEFARHVPLHGLPQWVFFRRHAPSLAVGVCARMQRRAAKVRGSQKSSTRTFSKVVSIVAVCSKCTRVLTFENLCQARGFSRVRLPPGARRLYVWVDGLVNVCVCVSVRVCLCVCVCVCVCV